MIEDEPNEDSDSTSETDVLSDTDMESETEVVDTIDAEEESTSFTPSPNKCTS